MTTQDDDNKKKKDRDEASSTLFGAINGQQPPGAYPIHDRRPVGYSGGRGGRSRGESSGTTAATSTTNDNSSSNNHQIPPELRVVAAFQEEETSSSSSAAAATHQLRRSSQGLLPAATRIPFPGHDDDTTSTLRRSLESKVLERLELGGNQTSNRSRVIILVDENGENITNSNHKHDKNNNKSNDHHQTSPCHCCGTLSMPSNNKRRSCILKIGFAIGVTTIIVAVVVLILVLAPTKTKDVTDSFSDSLTDGGKTEDTTYPTLVPSSSNSTSSSPTNSSPTIVPQFSARFEFLYERIIGPTIIITPDMSGDNTKFRDVTTYPHQALTWLADVDELYPDLQLTPTQVLIERYVMVLWFMKSTATRDATSTGGDEKEEDHVLDNNNRGLSWTESFHFLFPNKTTCQWNDLDHEEVNENTSTSPHGIICSGKLPYITEIRMGKCRISIRFSYLF